AVQLRRVRCVQRRISRAADGLEAAGRRRESDRPHERGPGRRCPDGALALRLRLYDSGRDAAPDLHRGRRGRDARARRRRRGNRSPRRDSAAAMREKAAHVMAIMQTRLHGLGVAWSDVTAIDIYTAQPIEPFLADTVLVPAGPSAIHGVRWFPSRPPIVGLEYEMDLRGVFRELLV